MTFEGKKIGLFIVSCAVMMLLVMGAGCTGKSPVEETTPVDGGVPTTEATPAATAAGAAEPTTGNDAATEPTNRTVAAGSAAASGTIYKVTGANVTLIDRTNGQSGISGIAAAANTTGTLVAAVSSFVGSELTVGRDTLPVYASVNISNMEADYKGLAAVTYDVPAAFVEEKTYDPTEIVLMHYADGDGWTALDTMYLGKNETDGVYYYASVAKSFSPFAIVSITDSSVEANVYDLTERDAYPVFINDINGSYKTQVIVKNALNNALSAVNTEGDSLENLGFVLEEALEAARKSVDDPKLVPYVSDGGSDSSSVPASKSFKSGKVTLVAPSASCITGISAEDAEKVTLVVAIVDSGSGFTDEDADRNVVVYQNMTITPSDRAFGDEIFLNFSVSKSALAANGGVAANVALYHYDTENEVWERLDTTYLKEDDANYYYSAAVDSFSPFAVGWIESRTLRFASTNIVTAKTIDDYYLDKIMKVTNPPLVHISLDNEMIPLLAKTCEMDGNNENWVIELDDSYVWSDGTAVTSADVIWSLEKDKFMDADLGSIKSAEALDEKTIKITLTEGNDKFYGTLINTNIQQEQFWADKDPSTYTRDTFVGCGPYYVSGIDLNNAVVTLVKNPYWEGENPYYDIVEIHSFELMEGAKAAIKLGEADAFWAYGTLSRSDAASMANSNPDMTYRVISGFSTCYFATFNMADETRPSADLGFRKAIGYGLDYQTIIDVSWQGDGEIGDYGLIPHNFANYPDDAHAYEQLTYNPTRAQELLAEAGFVDSDSDGIREWNGQEVTVRVLGAQSGFRHTVADTVSLNLEALGLDVDLCNDALLDMSDVANSNSWFYKKWNSEYDITINNGNDIGLRGGKGGLGIGDTIFRADTKPAAPAQGVALYSIKDPYFYTLSDNHDYNGILNYYANNVTSLSIKWGTGEYIVYNRNIDGWEAVSVQRLLNIPCLLELEPRA
jgi:PGF-pre-PGF domain-containing protein